MIPGRRYMTISALIQIATPIMQTSMSALQALNQELSPKTKGTLIIFNDFAMQKSGPQNSEFSSFNRVPWYNCQILADWGENPSLDMEMESWADALMEKLIALENAIKEGEPLAGKWGYYNAGNGKVAASVAFGGKYGRLREVKRKFDPDNAFSKWHPIEPADALPN